MADNARRLAAVDAIAAAAGLRPGQSMTDALALCPQMKIVEAEPEEDQRALTRLADWCLRFSPAVAVDAPDGILLDIDGCAHLWGGEEALAHAMLQRLAAQDIPARAAIADTFGAAWALARYGAEDVTIAAHNDTRRLAPLPVAALRIDETVADQLRHLGLKTIAHLTAMPRAALRKRFGAGLMLQLARALGEEEGALIFRTPPARWIERAVFAEPISTPEAVARIITDLAVRLCAKLDEYGLGALRFDAAFHRCDGETTRRTVRAALPLRDIKRLAALFAPKLESVDPGFGVEIVTLTALRVQPLTYAQADLDQANPQAAAADLAPFVDRLVNRFGAERVWRATVQESHVPERAVTRVAPLTPATKRLWASCQPRPVRLFARPHPIDALAVAPDDPPFLFRWQGRAHRIRNAEGPERIAAEWWRKPWSDNEIDRVRDYYQVEDEAGARFWLFRTGLYGSERPTRWWLHGLFA
ncbi:MAG: DNA polymerase Y family protein [Pseudomonadota bacterium]